MANNLAANVGRLAGFWRHDAPDIAGHIPDGIQDTFEGDINTYLVEKFSPALAEFGDEAVEYPVQAHRNSHFFCPFIWRVLDAARNSGQARFRQIRVPDDAGAAVGIPEIPALWFTYGETNPEPAAPHNLAAAGGWARNARNAHNARNQTTDFFFKPGNILAWNEVVADVIDPDAADAAAKGDFVIRLFRALVRPDAIQARNAALAANRELAAEQAREYAEAEEANRRRAGLPPAVAAANAPVPRPAAAAAAAAAPLGRNLVAAFGAANRAMFGRPFVREGPVPVADARARLAAARRRQEEEARAAIARRAEEARQVEEARRAEEAQQAEEAHGLLEAQAATGNANAQAQLRPRIHELRNTAYGGNAAALRNLERLGGLGVPNAQAAVQELGYDEAAVRRMIPELQRRASEEDIALLGRLARRLPVARQALQGIERRRAAAAAEQQRREEAERAAAAAEAERAAAEQRQREEAERVAAAEAAAEQQRREEAARAEENLQRRAREGDRQAQATLRARAARQRQAAAAPAAPAAGNARRRTRRKARKNKGTRHA